MENNKASLKALTASQAKSNPRSFITRYKNAASKLREGAEAVNGIIKNSKIRFSEAYLNDSISECALPV